LDHDSAGNAARLLPNRILDYALDIFLPNPIVLVGIASAVVLLALAQQRNREGVWPLFFLIALGWFFLTSGRPGASYTYFLEAAIGCSIVIGMFLTELVSSKDHRFLYFVLVCLIIALAANFRALAWPQMPSYDERAERAQIVTLLSELKTKAGEFVLADPQYIMDPGFWTTQ